MADRERLVAAGLERARGFTWAETARRTVEVYRALLNDRAGKAGTAFSGRRRKRAP
jgi:hypothetical protein